MKKIINAQFLYAVDQCDWCGEESCEENWRIDYSNGKSIPHSIKDCKPNDSVKVELTLFFEEEESKNA